MKIIHTGDWHLGQTFYDNDRRGEHLIFLNWLKEQIQLHEVDVLLIAGDVFDSPNPSAESQKMYYHFLFEVSNENRDLQIVIIAGNHDSASRLEAPNPLLENLNICVRGVVRRSADGEIDFNHLVVPLQKGGCCLAVPYLRQGDYPESETYAQGVQKLYEALYNNVRSEQYPIIAMGHLQATGSEISENDNSERTVIGGLEGVSPNAFADGIAYTALGHLHRGQRVSKRENVRYAGAPLPMSFAERNNRQGVVLVTITDETVIERLEFDTPIKLMSIPNTPLPLCDVIEEIGKLPDGEINDTSPYLEIKVLITEPEPSLRYQIEKALERKSVRLARISPITLRGDRDKKVITYEELQTINPLEMATNIFKGKFGGEDMPENMKTLLQEIIKEVEQ